MRLTKKMLKMAMTPLEIRAALEAHAEACRAALREMRARPSLPADLRGNLRGTDLSYTDLRGTDLRGTDLRGTDLSYTDLSYTNLRGAKLIGTDLSYTDLRGANLRDADLSYTKLIDADLSYTDLRGNLRGSNLRDADLSYSNLHGSNLRDANLSYSNLRGTDLRDADLRDANLRGSNLPEGYRIASLCFGGWPVTVTPTRTTIGCQSHSNESWLCWGVDAPEIAVMHEDAASWWLRHREAVCAVIGDVMSQ